VTNPQSYPMFTSFLYHHLPTKLHSSMMTRIITSEVGDLPLLRVPSEHSQSISLMNMPGQHGAPLDDEADKQQYPLWPHSTARSSPPQKHQSPRKSPRVRVRLESPVRHPLIPPSNLAGSSTSILYSTPILRESCSTTARIKTSASLCARGCVT
jgi:hypothetical protein